MNMIRREMDLEKTHIKLLAVDSNLKKCRIYIDREKKRKEYIERMVFPALVFSLNPRQ